MTAKGDAVMAADPSRSAAGNTILVVDDERFSRKVLQRMLRGLGWEHVEEAGDGREAMDRIGVLGPTLAAVISDFDMPDVNGLQLLQAIRVGAAGPRRGLPVILLTGRADRQAVGTAMALDCDAFLIKPTTAEHVRHRLDRVLSEEHQLRSASEYASITPPAPAPPAPATATGLLIAVADAREGMVLAADLMGAGGHVLMQAGHVLSRKALAALHDLEIAGDDLHRVLVVG
jgi:CheY-like chemotaxis protein